MRRQVTWDDQLKKLEWRNEAGTYTRITLATGGGGTSSHSSLTSGSLIWTASGHTGTASRVAIFNSSGDAAYATTTAVLEDAGGITRGQVHAYPLAQP